MTEAGHGASCLCGAVRIRISGKLRNVSNCHCGQCVKTHGHYAAYSAADDGKIEIDGEESITWFRSSPMARRAFFVRFAVPNRSGKRTKPNIRRSPPVPSISRPD